MNLLHGLVAKRKKELGINNNELARRLGVAAGTISRVLSGKMNLTKKFVDGLAKELQLNEQDIWNAAEQDPQREITSEEYEFLFGIQRQLGQWMTPAEASSLLAKRPKRS